MNHCVPEFEVDEDYPISSSADMPRQKNMQQDEIMELLWQNGQVVVQSQNPRLPRKYSPPPAKSTHYDHHQQEYHQPPSRPAPPPNSDSTAQPFMQEDEMISWLEYPLEDPGFDRDLTDLLYHPPGPPPSTSAVTAALRPAAPPPPATQQQIPAQAANFSQFTRTRAKIPDSRPSASSRYDAPRESTVVDSSDTPAVRQKSKIPPTKTAVEVSGGGSFSGRCAIAGTSTAGGSNWCKSMSRDGETCELTLESSPSGTNASATATADLMTQPPADGRKRKGREPANDATTECQSEDAEIESHDTKKHARGAAGKRSRAAEVHNLSERRRRDRINEKMKALQELIPRCTKTDKASMLDEAIEYLKSLQLQVQESGWNKELDQDKRKGEKEDMMSMGCGMVPVMFPGLQQYLPSMGMGMGMTMGMGMEMGMTGPMIPFPGILPGSGLPTPGNPRFPLPAFPMPPMPGHDASGTQQAGSQTGVQSHMPMRPNMAYPYQQGTGTQQMSVQTPQSHPLNRAPTSQVQAEEPKTKEAINTAS